MLSKMEKRKRKSKNIYFEQIWVKTRAYNEVLCTKPMKKNLDSGEAVWRGRGLNSILFII